jgi:hypothetical protein
MGEAVFFRNLTTKGLTAVNSGERYFEGYLTVQVKDKQGEVTIVDELMKVLPVWIDRGAPISDTHSNRIIGKGINYSKVEYKDKDGEIYPAIKVTGKIHKNYELDNDIWMKIKSGEYKGLSFGGATKSDREPMRMKDGSIAYSLKDLEHYEVAVCRDPAVPLALITEFNILAKATVDGQDLGDGRMLIKCDKFGCYVDKENSEAGLKAPEARNEALVYDDKTHDQPSETPLENQAKIQKGKKPAEWHSDEWWKKIYPPYDKMSEQEKEGYRVSRLPEPQGLTDSEKEDIVREGMEEEKKKIKKGEKEIDDIVREIPDKENKKDAIDRQTSGNISTLDSRRKGEDWSNADGDMQTSMNTQNVDEGGMGKHKQKRDSVLQGYGGEQNNTGEVGWSGSGSPYPKKKGYSDEFKEDKENWEQQEYDKKTKKRKKKAIMTNIHTRLKNLDFLLRTEEATPGHYDSDDKITPTKRKKKDGEFGGMNTGEVEWTEPRDTANSRTKRDKDVA